MRKGNYLCPACGKDLASKTIHSHTENCSVWRAQFGEAYPQFKYSRSPELYLPDAREGVDYVQCKECLAFGWDFRFRRMMDHITGLHKLDEAAYAARHPGAPIRLASTLVKRKATTQEHYGVDNVFQAKAVKEASKETMLDKYGDTCPMRIDELKAKAAATNLERYGAENPFGSAEIQQKIQQTSLAKYGVACPSQSSDVVNHRAQTILERYGAPHYFETEDFKEKFKHASLARFGTEHPMQSEEGRKAHEEGCIQALGVPNPLLLSSVQQKCQESSRERFSASYSERVEAAKQKGLLPCLCGHASTSLTQMKRHRATCVVWKTRNRGKIQMARLAVTFQKRYGADHPSQVAEFEAKRKATNLERYGAENPFSRKSYLYGKVQQASREAERTYYYGQDNAFAKPEVKEKIKQTTLDRYGVEYPNQSPEVRAKTKATNLERYGTEECLASSCVREKIVATNQERYGGPAPSCNPEIVERARVTNQERYGVDWTCQDPEIRQKQIETEFNHYGTWFLASEEGREVKRQTMLLLYGVEHALQNPEIYQRYIQTSLERYGATHAMKNPDVLMRALEVATRPGPNKLEQRFAAMCPEFLYTGTGTYWRWLPLLRHAKNPDFILPGLDSEQPKRGVTKVVELFGDYWHSPKFQGVPEDQHEQETILGYADIGISCLVIWEHELKQSPEAVRARVLAFLENESVPDEETAFDLFFGQK